MRTLLAVIPMRIGITFAVILTLFAQSSGLLVAEPAQGSNPGEQARRENLEFGAAICAHHLSSGLWVVGRNYERTPEEVVAQDIAPFRYFGWGLISNTRWTSSGGWSR